MRVVDNTCEEEMRVRPGVFGFHRPVLDRPASGPIAELGIDLRALTPRTAQRPEE